MAGTTVQNGAAGTWAKAPCALIRRLDGCITYWSPEMERRYGYASEEAVGKVAHELLRTVSWQALDEIETALVNRNSWRGGLIHHRADDQPVIASNHWHLHQADDRAPLVTELHADIVPAGTAAGSDLADILAAMTHQLSEPLMAASGYVGAAHRDLQPAWPHKVRASEAIDRAGRQLARARETLSRMRALGARLRDDRQVAVHARLTATMEQTERTMQGVQAAARSGEASLQRSVALQNIRLFQRLLRQDGLDKLDPPTRQVVAQLLVDEEARLVQCEGEASGQAI